MIFRAKGSLIPHDFAESYAEQRPVPKRKAKRGKITRPQRKGPECKIVPIPPDGIGPDVTPTDGLVDGEQPIESSGQYDEVPGGAPERNKQGSFLNATPADVIAVANGDEMAFQSADESHTGLTKTLSAVHIHDDDPEAICQIAVAPTASPDPDSSLGHPSQTPITTTDGLSHVQEAGTAKDLGSVAACDEVSASAPLAVAEPEAGVEALYCPECYLPLHPDPKPEKLYIFLHALRYTSASLGAFETPMPEWAAEGYTWE